jgi:N-acetylneuraminate synthase/N,N'-diacetyllegionaminate synthase
MKQIKIAGRMVGPGAPCFVMAEAGVNHNGNFQLAKKMVEAAKRAGADAIKFQIFRSERMVARTAKKAPYQSRATGGGSQYEMLKKLELTEDEFRKLAAYAKRKSVIFLASAFDEKSVDFLANIKVPAFKIASGEITNFPLLRHIASKKKPVIMSTGMSTIAEIREAIRVLNSGGAKSIVLLHCVSDYPAKVEEVNLMVMETLRRTFNLPIGFSDHTLGITVPIAAAALGASIIEKHFTLDRKLPGPDHKASLEPSELKEMVAHIREVEKALGNRIKRPTKSEEAMKNDIRRSIVARINIPRGRVITMEMLELKRPGTGLGPRYLKKVIGKRAKKDMMADELVTLEKLV